MVVNGFVNVVISTLERRFGLLSTQTGIIAGSYDIGSMISVIPITYFGARVGSSKPRYEQDTS
jgi:organic anion transporter 4A